MENNNNNFNLTEKDYPIIKNISYDEQTGNLFLIDNKNNHFLCDIFGRKKTNFIPSISGIANADERKNISLTSRNSNSRKLLTELFSPKKKTSKKEKYINYFPTIRRFEGYYLFPRPIAPPYSNLSGQEKIDKNREKINNCLKSYFSYEKNKNYVVKKNDNNGLSFLTYDLNDYDILKYDTEKILKVIEDTFDEYKEKYKYKLNILKLDPAIKAITKFKKYILENKDIKIINGRKLKEYNPKIKEQYKITQNLIQKKILPKNIPNRNVYQLRNCNTFSTIKKIPKLKISQSHNKKINFDKINTICSSRDLTIGKKIKMNFGMFSYEEETKKKKDEELINDKDINNDEKNNLMKKLDEKIKENDISFISIINEKDNDNKKYQIKNMNKLKIMNENEKNLLKGFIQEEPKKEKYIYKLLKPKIKTNGYNFIKDIELLRKTNPIAFKLEEKKEEKNLKQLEKNLKALRINANNAMKIKLKNLK